MINFTPIHGTIYEIILGAKPECRANFNNMKVIIIKGTAPLGLGYGIGAEADFNDAQAAELIERGYAEPIEEVKQAVVEQPQETIKEVTENTKELEQAVPEPVEEVKKAVTKRK